MQIIVLLALTLSFFSCAPTPSPLKQTYDEGLAIMNRVNFESSPEEKMQTAKDLLAHAEQYDRQMRISSSPGFRMEALEFLRSERATAAALMRDAAANYEKQNHMEKARDSYRAVLTTFTREEEAAIRASAETELKRLGDTAQRERS